MVEFGFGDCVYVCGLEDFFYWTYGNRILYIKIFLSFEVGFFCVVYVNVCIDLLIWRILLSSGYR